MSEQYQGEGKPSPCQQKCELVGQQFCRYCQRTVTEITSWSRMSVSQCHDVMQKINGSRGTHLCPACQQPTYCAINDGKSLSACWCQNVATVDLEDINESDNCLCRRCLMKLLEKQSPTTGLRDQSGKK